MGSAFSNVDLVWVLLCSALVMLMQAGFCLLETGFSRAKNSINVAIKNLFDFCISSIAYWAVGFGLMFGASYHGLFGTTRFAPEGTDDTALMTFLLFQLMFCSTSTTIISGAVAERIRFSAYLLVALVMSLVVYPVFGHWAWGGSDQGVPTGWLGEIGFIDFAGSTVVHSLGGWASLALVLILGPRIGKFGPAARPMRGHSLTLSTLGVLLLWFGWFGFNGGSTLRVDGRIPLILINTNLAAAAGGAAALAVAWYFERKAIVGQVINGVVAGLVGVTASCQMISPGSALLIGVASGVVSVLGSYALERVKIDDVVGAIPVHGFCGLLGTLAVALFGDLENFHGHSRLHQFGVQAIGAASAAVWSFGTVGVCLGTVNLFWKLRSPEEDERMGLNIAEHDASTDLMDLLTTMDEQRRDGDFTTRVEVEPHTEVGQIATEYNRVLERVSNEIRAREEAAEAARKAELRYRALFENALEGIFQTTPEGLYSSANPRLAEIYGYGSADELMAEVRDIGSQLYVDPSRREAFRQCMAQHGKVVGFESQVRRRDGQVIWISENAKAVKDAAGKLLYYEGTVEEITERKHNAALQAEVSAAVAASHSKSLFLANMSHEIRTPLNGVIGMLELLRASSMTPQQSRYLEIANGSATMLLGLINNILDFSKIESGKLELERIQVDLRALVMQQRDAFLHRAAQKNVIVMAHVDEHVPPLVWGDSGRIQQLLMNLLSNALKFTPSGKVEIRVGSGESANGVSQIRFSVSDTGIGIPADRRNRLFEHFSQVDASTTRKYGGTGLGLALCKQLVGAMGGKIDVDSEPGKGSTFWFELPLETAIGPAVMPVLSAPLNLPAQRDAQPLPRLRSESAAKASANESGTPILVVDDNDINQLVAVEMLRAEGFSCRTASNGREAVEWVQREPFALVLMDCQMPEMDGFEATEKIRAWEADHKEDEKPIPIIALTASAIRGDRERCIACGMNDYATKPLIREQLLRQIRRQLPEGTSPNLRETVVVETSVIDTTTSEAMPMATSVEPQTAEASAIAVLDELAAAIDQEALIDRCSGDTDFVGKILRKFRERLPTDCHKIYEAIERRDVTLVKRLTHTLKGTAANLAAWPLRETVAQIEQSALQEDWAEILAGRELLESRMQQCLDMIGQLIDEAP